jgi:chemotaxis protein CheX
MPVLDTETCETAMDQVVTHVFESMLHTTVTPVPAAPRGAGELLTSTLHFSGAWTGATLLEITRDQALAFTGQLLDMTPPTSIDDDVLDAMGELVNMIGGNLKTILPSGVELSLPAVVRGGDYTVRMIGAKVINRWSFEGDAGVFSVTLVEVNHA